jgi:hypothetical protein
MTNEEKASEIQRVLEVCERNRQRITYQALGDLVGLPAQSVMAGLDLNSRHSWVVNTETEHPTEYTEDQMHPELFKKKDIIRNRDGLIAFLESDKRSPAREPAVRSRRPSR